MRFSAKIFTVLFMMIVAVSAIAFEGSTSSDYTPTKAALYTVCEHDGKIAVFEGESNEPIEITDIYVSGLPLKDRQLLKQGITANTNSELCRILEDYDG